MLNQKVLMSGANYFSTEAPINPYYSGGSADVVRAMAEHAAIREAFMDAGIEVIDVPPPKNCQDGVYTANWALCRGEKCVLGRLPSARRAEEEYAGKVLARLGKTVLRVPGGLKFSGQGDALPCGRYLLAGSGYRSDLVAQQFAAQVLGFELVQLHAIPVLDANGRPATNASSGLADSLFYDVDLAIAVLRDDLIAYCPDAFDEPSRAKIESLPIEKIVVDYVEATKGFACNLVSTGETVIMSANAPELRAEIEKRGLRVVPINAPELSRGGGYIRCVSLSL